MRFITYVRACVLLATAGFCPMFYGQTSTHAPYLIESAPDMRSAFCSASKSAATDSNLWPQPRERSLGLNVTLDCLPQPAEKTWPWPGLWERVRCPKGCQICGTVYDKKTSLKVCTKG